MRLQFQTVAHFGKLFFFLGVCRALQKEPDCVSFYIVPFFPPALRLAGCPSLSKMAVQLTRLNLHRFPGASALGR